MFFSGMVAVALMVGCGGEDSSSTRAKLTNDGDGIAAETAPIMGGEVAVTCAHFVDQEKLQTCLS